MKFTDEETARARESNQVTELDNEIEELMRDIESHPEQGGRNTPDTKPGDGDSIWVEVIRSLVSIATCTTKP